MFCLTALFLCAKETTVCDSSMCLYLSDLETKTLQGVKGENSLSFTGSFIVDNSSIEFQKFADKEILRIPGPLTADFTVKVRSFQQLTNNNTLQCLCLLCGK